MVANVEERIKIDLQMDEFKNAKELFGIPMVILTRTKKSPCCMFILCFIIAQF